MAMTTFVDGVLQSQLLDAEQQQELLRLQEHAKDARVLAQELMRRDWLTPFQVNQIIQGNAGDLVLGPFVLLERIGEGGMGQVFKARQKMLNRVVALKVIRKQCLSNPKVILRFQREIVAAGQLNHPHIVRAFDADQVNGTYYIAMEFIEGNDLARIVKDIGPLPIKQACEYIRQTALGLQHAVERGMVHRDIKPANLLVTRAIPSDRRRSSAMLARPMHIPPLDSAKTSGVLARRGGSSAEPASAYPWGMVKILDMGLARCTDPEIGLTQLTHAGTVVGTPEYIAPEQARDSHTSDIRADLYSLGCTLYFLLSGQPPFAGGTLSEKLLQHQFDEAEPVAEARRETLLTRQPTNGLIGVTDEMLRVPSEVHDVICRLLAKRPEDRYQTPIELADALQSILQHLKNGTSEAPAPKVDRPGSNVAAMSPSTLAEVAPLVRLAPRSGHSHRLLGKVLFALASAGGLAMVVLIALAAAVLTRGARTQASTQDDPPGHLAGEPTWKQTVRNAIQKRTTWDEARQDLLKHRWAYATAGQARQIDDLLMKLPTPFDNLERGRFDIPLPAGMPAEVLGIYGLTNAGKPVTSVSISPNGRWLIANEEAGVRLFDVQGSAIPYKILAHNARVNQTSLSLDGRHLASASDDGSVRIWDVATRNRQQTFDKHARPVTRIAFHPDGSLMASAGRDGMIRIWDPRSGAEIRRFDSGDADVRGLTFTNDGREIIWIGASTEVRWASVKSNMAGTFKATFPGQRVLTCQPRGDNILVGGTQGLVHICAFDGKQLVAKATFQSPQPVTQIAFSPDGKTFVTAGAGVSVWDASTWKMQKTWTNLRTPIHAAAFAPDGRHLVLGGGQNQLIVARLQRHDMDALKAALD